MKRTEIERRLEIAIDSILAGRPKNDELKALSAQGKLKLNYSSVALEAGVSRTLFSMADCAYPQIREKIDKLKPERVPLLKAAQQLTESIYTLQLTMIRQRYSFACLVSRLTKRTSRSMLKLGEDIENFENNREIHEIRIPSSIPVKKTIKDLTLRQNFLKRKLAKRDTLYASLVIQASSFEKGRHPNKRRLTKASKADRIRGISIVQ